jgi:ABC-type lipoprotein export system ATPase subunit
MSARSFELPEHFVSCRGLSKIYVTPSGRIEALHDVDALFEIGKITVVVGPSGSGKSTLLRAIAGLDRPTTGELTVGGQELRTASGAELRRHRRDVVTYISQKPADNLVPHLTLIQQPDATRETATELLAAFGVAHRARSRPAELSGGEQARAAFALALSRDTPLVVADELTAELDRPSAQGLLTAIRDRAGAGTAFILATHDRDVVEAADRVLTLNRGRVISNPEQPQTELESGRHRSAAGPVVSASEVSKSYRRGRETIIALRSATIELHAGEIQALLGRSGSGKSTLLSLLGGWQSPDNGEIRYAGAPSGPSRLRWHELAFLPQRFGLLPELTVRENIDLPARLSGRPELYRMRIEELLARLGLDEFADRLPRETSIGQQQRTALARALALMPTVLLADEPTSHQDAGWRDAVWQLLYDVAEEKTSCLVATHEEDIAAFATTISTIDAGVTHTLTS